jgi:DNA-binding LacI/PurR family transcriptional regulator
MPQPKVSVTIHDIARELNLSSMTVSRVLSSSGKAKVAPATRARVTEAAQTMGYRPNRNAAALASGRTFSIGLWISHLQSSVYSQIADACRGEIERAQMDISISEMDWHFSGPEVKRRFPWPLDGILAVDPPEQERLGQLITSAPWQGIPRVNLGSGQNVVWSKDYVRIDLKEASSTAVRHLLSVGCKRIAYVTSRGLDRPGMSHYDGYLEALQGSGSYPEIIACDNWNCSTVRSQVRDYVQKYGHPDGVYCHHDEMAMATYRALRDLKLHIPNDVALIGCEGNEFLEYFDPPISTMALPIKEMARTAWQVLEQRMQDPASPVQGITLPYEFLKRESSR